MSYALPPPAVKPGFRAVGDRRAALWLLSVPLLVALVAFTIAVVATLMGEMAQGSPRFYAAALSFSALLLSVMLLPAYLLSLGWYAWWTRGGDHRQLRLGLWLAPLVALLFAWFPATLVPGLQPLGQDAMDPLRTYLLAGILVMLLGYAWSSIVFVILRYWRDV
ncbi:MULTISPECIES: hypothetical protein [Pseudomonas]|jgi:hypothetical protein|uniref:Uncharacterized protein n=2 Tax=Pseudomonas putida TaxID=303 RepID=A0AA34RVE7_PSEPU|nr:MULTISPECIES: hypothetical protein [Pseudomonas]HBK49903.1 hypothetical protein [Pseudomonas sp.]ADR62046.1 Hypothetical protein PPUBIRD1_4475 [Pseudomonas putida BIRD-1]AJA14251.1 hypothetical protein RPPX_13135 [Pseudomonas putida S12]AOX11164.1 hypothetical protein Q5O_23160 [Pseudomonas putida JB]AVD93701.1 hypothetical protein C4Q27_15385 [Pseudomonas sp. SWI36]